MEPPDWIKKTLGWVKWIVTVVVAVLVAHHEGERRKAGPGTADGPLSATVASRPGPRKHTMRTVNPEKHEARRRHILAAAAECFAIKGFQDTRTADICAAAGMSSGNLFHYFPNKQAIFFAIFEQDGRDNVMQLEQALSAADPLQALLGFAEFMAVQADYPHLAGFMLEVIANAKRDEGFATLLDHNDRDNRDGLIMLLERAQKAGQIDRAIDPKAAANWILVLIEGVFVRASADPDFKPGKEKENLRRIITQFLAAQADRQETSP